MILQRLMILIIVLLSIVALGCSSGEKSTEHVALAQCLTEKGVIMYGTEWCPHCKDQKKAFGDAFEFINYVDCDKYKEQCINAGVKGYPTWVVNGSLYPGEQPLARLAALMECPI